MIEYKEYAKFENLEEFEKAIEIGLDIEFMLCNKRWNISWRNDRPFICECPEGVAVFYADAPALLEHKIDDKHLKEMFKKVEVLSM